MIESLSARLIAYLFDHEYIKKDIPVYRYGSELLISSVIGFVIVIVAGFMTSTIYDALLFLCMFVILRLRTGGYHARSYLMCNLYMLLIYLLYTVLKTIEINNIILLLASLLSLYVIYRNAPAEHINKKVKNREEHKLYSVIISVIYIIMLLVFIYIKSEMVYLPAFVLVSTAILLKAVYFNINDEGMINNIN